MHQTALMSSCDLISSHAHVLATANHCKIGTSTSFCFPMQITGRRNDPGGDLGVTGWGNMPTPYDLLIATNKAGSGDGIVQKITFILSTPGADLDKTLLDETIWSVMHFFCSVGWYRQFVTLIWELKCVLCAAFIDQNAYFVL